METRPLLAMFKNRKK